MVIFVLFFFYTIKPKTFSILITFLTDCFLSIFLFLFNFLINLLIFYINKQKNLARFVLILLKTKAQIIV